MKESSSLAKGFSFFVKGVLMGLADLVPGISGSSVALALGIYERFLSSLKNFFDGKVFFLLLSLRFKEYFERIDGKFLFPLLAGIATTITVFAHVFVFFLSDPYYRFILFSFFLGAMLAATLLIGREIIITKQFDWLALLLGAVCALIFSAFPRHNIGDVLQAKMSLTFANEGLSGLTLPVLSFIQPAMIFSGILAICAMMLPGISGSYVLVLLGVYTKVLLAFTTFVGSCKMGAFHQPSFLILGNLALGCLIGAALFARVILWTLQKYRAQVFSFLLGVMAGSLKVLWPFSHSVIHPSFFSIVVFLSFIFFLSGFILVWKMQKRKLVYLSH